MDELRIKKLSEPVTFTIRVDKSIVDFYDDLAGKTNRSRNELIGLALDYAKDKIIVEHFCSRSHFLLLHTACRVAGAPDQMPAAAF